MIADSVMKWIGFGVAPLGEVKSEGEVKQMAKGTSAGTERIVGAGVGKLGGKERGEQKAPGRRGGGNGGDGGSDDTGEVAGGGEAAKRGEM